MLSRKVEAFTVDAPLDISDRTAVGSVYAALVALTSRAPAKISRNCLADRQHHYWGSDGGREQK
jgi:hypothetical protein